MKKEVEEMMSLRLLQLYKAQRIPIPDNILHSLEIEWDLVRDL